MYIDEVKGNLVYVVNHPMCQVKQVSITCLGNYLRKNLCFLICGLATESETVIFQEIHYAVFLMQVQR